MASTKARIPALLAAGLLACFLLLAPATASAAGKPGPRCKPTTTAAVSALPRQVPIRQLARATVCVINQRRVARGLRRLRLNPRLSKAAVWHSHDMVHRHYFAHVSRSGTDVVARLNMLNPRYREIGIGVLVGGPQQTDLPAATYTTTFGARHR